MTAPDDREYLTVDEFAGLPSAVQLAVWDAEMRGRMRFARTGLSRNGARRYHREDVRALLEGMPGIAVVPGC